MFYIPNYASALRCIGQALERQNIDIFELIADANGFVVQCADPKPPYTGIFRLHYPADSITILDREGQAQRRRAKSVFRFDSLPQILRATGRYVDAKRVELLRLSSGWGSAPNVEIEYQTRAGQTQAEILLMDLIREIAVNMYKQRTRVSNPVEILTRRN